MMKEILRFVILAGSYYYSICGQQVREVLTNVSLKRGERKTLGQS